MLIYNYHPETGDFLSVGFADPNPRVSDPDPLDPNDWIIPGSATHMTPPAFDSETETCRWNGTEWIVAEIVVEEPEEPPEPTEEELWLAYQGTAMSALFGADAVALKCFKVGIAYPAEWLTYSLALTTIANATTGDPSIPLPTTPTVPVEISGL